MSTNNDQDTTAQTPSAPQDTEQDTNTPTPRPKGQPPHNEPQDGEQDGQGDQQQDTDQQDDPKPARGKGNSEAAKYRTRLREAEAERDQLRQQFEAERETLTNQLGAAHDQVINNYLTAQGVELNAAALRKFGHNPSSLMDDDCTVNREKMLEALEGLKSSGFQFKHDNHYLGSEFRHLNGGEEWSMLHVKADRELMEHVARKRMVDAERAAAGSNRTTTPHVENSAEAWSNLLRG